MSEIVVGVDFSESDQRLVDTVVPIAKTMGATVHLFHVEQKNGGQAEHVKGTAGEPLPQGGAGMKNATERIDELSKDYEKAGVAVRASVREGGAVSLLLQEAADSGCVMLVLGTHGYSRIERALLGHVVDGVLRRAPVPVLVVPTIRS